MLISCMPIASSVVEAFGLICALFAAWWAWREWRRDKRNRCADVYGQLLVAFTSSEIFHAFETLIDKRGVEDIELNCRRGGFSERVEDLDKILLFLNQVCYLRENNMIGEKEFQTFRYPLLRTLSTDKILKYIENLQQEFSGEFMYDPLMTYAETIETAKEQERAETLTETRWHDYLIKHYGGWTHTAQSVCSRVNTVCDCMELQLDELVKTVDITIKHIKEIPSHFAEKSAAQISSLRTAVRHCCMAKHGVWPEN